MPTSSIHSCCSAASGVILSTGSQSRQRIRKSRKCSSFVLIAEDISLVPGRLLRPLELVRCFGFPLESAHACTCTCMHHTTEIKTYQSVRARLKTKEAGCNYTMTSEKRTTSLRRTNCWVPSVSVIRRFHCSCEGMPLKKPLLLL